MIPRHDWEAESLRAVGLTADYDEPVDLVDYQFADVPTTDPNRREVLKTLGAGLMIAVAADASNAQEPARGRRPARRRGGNRGATTIAARVHIGEDGGLTVMTGKVECGQGARAEISQAAAEELRVPIDRVALVMADTGLVPDDGGTYGSRTTPSTIPAVRTGCASARMLLVGLAAKKWGVDAASIAVQDGCIRDEKEARTITYADLAADAAQTLERGVSREVTLTPVASWRTMGVSTPRPNGRDIVTGSHEYPSDVVRPGMLYGKILRAEFRRDARIDRPGPGAVDGRRGRGPRRRVRRRGRAHDGPAQRRSTRSPRRRSGRRPRSRRAPIFRTIFARTPTAGFRQTRSPTRSARRRNRSSDPMMWLTCSTRRWSRARRLRSGRTAG